MAKEGVEVADSSESTTGIAVSADGVDEVSRAQRRQQRDAANAKRGRGFALGVVVTLLGGAFWGFSGTSASFLFDTYHIDTLWLMSVRQVLAGLLFMVVIAARYRSQFCAMWRDRVDRRRLLLFAGFGLWFNQFWYLTAVRLTNAGTATVMQCLELLIIMAITCVQARRRPRRREVFGVALALCGTYLIATGGNPTSLAISPAGLVAGAMCAISAALLAVLPAKILPKYGSPVVTGSGMLVAGIVSSIFVQPWRNVPTLDAPGLGAFAIFIFVGSFLAFMLYMQGVKEIGSMPAALLGTVEPVSATITSAIMLGTVFMPTDLAGFAMIIAMVFLTV